MDRRARRRRRTWAAVAGTALVATLVVEPAPVSVASYPGSNGTIAFRRNPGSTLWTVAADGTNEQQIPGIQQAHYPSFSPDGKKIAYWSGDPFARPKGSIDVVELGGQGPRTVVPEDNFVQIVGGPTWSPDGSKLAFAFLDLHDYVAGIRVVDATTGAAVATLESPETLQDGGYTYHAKLLAPAWSPVDDQKLAVEHQRLMKNPDGTGVVEIATITLGGTLTNLTSDTRADTLPDWSPDGSRIAYVSLNPDATAGVVKTIASSGGSAKQVTADTANYKDVAFSPDGKKLLLDKGGNLYTIGSGAEMGTATFVPGAAGDRNEPTWGPGEAGGLTVTLNSFEPDGTSLDGNLTITDEIDVVLTIRNETQDRLESFEFTGGQPLVVDPRSPGGLEIVSGADPPIPSDLTLEPGETSVHSFVVEATRNGIAAAHTQVTAETPAHRSYEDAHSLKFVIGDGLEVTKQLGQWIAIRTIDKFLQQMFGQWHAGSVERANELFTLLSGVLSPAERELWFGSSEALTLTPFDYAMGVLRGTAAEMYAASTPKVEFKGYTVEQLNGAYNAAFKKELGKGVSEYVRGYAELGSTAKKGLQDTWSEVMLASFYMMGTATPEERTQFETFMVNVANNSDTRVDNIVNTVKNDVRNWRANGTYFGQAIKMSVADVTLQSPDLQAQMAQERKWRENALRLASTDPMAFQAAYAKREAELANLVMPIILDTILGGGIVKVGGSLGNVVFKGSGAAVLRAGEAAGVVDEGGQVVKGSKTAIDVADSSVQRGIPNAEAAYLGEAPNYLDKTEGATIVRSSDLGNIYELPNVGGVPETTLEAKAGILGELESGWAAKSGEQIKLAEVLKPSSPYRKPGGVAKLELTEQKTGKPAMLDAGAPPDTLAEANVWKSDVHPSELPGWDDLGKARQKAALKEWNAANEKWEAWQNPPPDSKTARLQQCIGRRNRVPLDLEPNKAGLQRFVTAEYEVTDVTEGQARAKLIRTKYYEVEVVDTTRDNRVVNRKVVVDSDVAAPQTPDADAVAVAKVVGETPDGRPILEPLTRAEREYIMPRYIDKNIKARRLKPGTKGAIPDLAEHGVTLVMEDASATAAGKLLPQFGLPFLGEGPGLAYLQRVARSLAGRGATDAALKATYEKMLSLVQKEGGFGQHAVVVTTDSRYLGAVEVSRW